METVVGVGEETRPKPCSPVTESAEQNDAVASGARVSENGEHKVAVADESGVIEDCVMMNGVSSLLKLKQDGEEEEEEEEEHGYQVGDFVWGKIKNHPWWPGQIYDPSEASDLALKTKQKGKKNKQQLLLVAYFGDGTFAWCGPSQLRPFAESFKECCSNVSSRGCIVAAVEEAVEEIGRHMERLLMIRDDDNQRRVVVKNAGIREGVGVRDVRREVISALLVGKPEGILEDVRGFAETVSFDGGLLELEVVKRKVSAFYRSERGYGLIEFPESVPVPGLEDKNNDDDDDGGGGAKRSTIEKEEALDDPDDEALIQRPALEKCSGFPDHRQQHRRKQKSIAEILESESCAVVRFEDGKGKSSRKKIKSRRMKEVVAVEEDSKGKRKKRDEGEREEDDNDSTPLASLRKRVKVDTAAAASSSVTSSTQTTKRERKKSKKYFSPEFLSDFGRKKSRTEPESSIVPSESQAGEVIASASNSLVVVVEEEDNNPCELLLLENGEGHQELSEELSNAVEFLRLGATTEEIRDLIRVSALGTEYPIDSSSRDMVREFMSIYRSFTYREGVNSKLLGSYSTADTDKEDVSGKEIEETGKEENETAKKQRKPKTARSKKQAGEVTETAKKERRRKKPESEKKDDEEEETRLRERKAKKPKSRKQGDEEGEASGSRKKEKKAKKLKFVEQEREESEKEFSGAELFITFGPGSSLPKKEALIEIYGKFGALDEERVCVSDSNFSACVAFLNVADGERAFESSLEFSPFASTSTVRFRLKYPNERAGAGEKKGEGDVPETKTVEMEHLKKKFEEMVALVDKSEGRMSEEVKVKLEEEMVNLLEVVRKMPLS